MTQEEFFNRYSYSVSRDRIGGGSFGTVYKAYDNTLHREVAIKVSEEKTTTDGKKTFSLKDEFEALSHVPKHPNIANYEEFYSFEMPNGIFDYAVMQYYPDGNLSDAIKQGLTDEQKEDIATQLLEGIDFLHKHKVVHRDLKPGNILVVRHGGKVIPLITDFGLSKATSVVDGSVFSNSFGAGTPKYSSPEQLQGMPLRFNTDLWSYGAILYELFTGTQLFSAGSGAANTAQADLEIYNKIVNGDVRGLSKMPEIWRKVAERCLVVDATKRAKDAVELFGLIRGDDDETEITVGPSTGSETEGLGGTIPSSKGGSGSTPPSKGAGGIKEASPKSIDEPKSKKALWVDLSIKIIWIVVGILVALLVLHLWQENESAPTDPDTQAYEACQTVEDYRAYMTHFGLDAKHYADAKSFVDQYVADSTEQALKAQQRTEYEKKEEAAYKRSTSVKAGMAYLNNYPQGKYVNEVSKRKAKFEKIARLKINTYGGSTVATKKEPFSVSSNRRVYFTDGNLQYNASANEWRIAPNPWDYIGGDNHNISPTYNGWIDLFGWGTGDNPVNKSTSDGDYFYYASWGAKSGDWLTLTEDEWDFVLNKRTTISGARYATAEVNDVKGLILLPDNWSESNYRLNTNNESRFGNNCISASTWNNVFAPAGAVFLPAAGHRHWSSTSVYQVGSQGYYWTCTPARDDGARAMSFWDGSATAHAWEYRCSGRSVRLARPAE